MDKTIVLLLLISVVNGKIDVYNSEEELNDVNLKIQKYIEELNKKDLNYLRYKEQRFKSNNFSVILQETMDIANGDPRVRDEALTRLNWTNCFEYLNNTVFHASRVVKTEWKMYVAWTDDEIRKIPIFNFVFPPQSILWQFSKEFDDEIKGIDWSTSELYLETNYNFNMLLLRTNVSGWYSSITSYTDSAISTDPKDNIRTMALKFYENGHLGIMNCVERLLFIFAPIDNYPQTYKEVEEAVGLVTFDTELLPKRCLDSDLNRKFRPEEPPILPPIVRKPSDHHAKRPIYSNSIESKDAIFD